MNAKQSVTFRFQKYLKSAFENGHWKVVKNEILENIRGLFD